MKIFSVEIFYKDCPKEIFSANIGVGVESHEWWQENEAIDDKIFFYADTENDMAKLAKPDNGADFQIVSGSLLQNNGWVYP